MSPYTPISCPGEQRQKAWLYYCRACGISKVSSLLWAQYSSSSHSSKQNITQFLKFAIFLYLTIIK